MKRFSFMMLALMVCCASFGQKTEFRFQATQARLLDVMSNAWNNESESYTLQSVYSKAPKF